MTEQQAIAALDFAHDKNRADFYLVIQGIRHNELSPTTAGEYLIDECNCDEDVAYEYSLAWVEHRERMEEADDQLSDWP